MEKLTFTNPYGDTLEIGSLTDDYILLTRGDFGGLNVANTTEIGYQQRGTSVIQKRYTQKSYIIGIGVKGVTPADFKNRMNKLSRFFEIEYTSAGDLTPFEMKVDANGYDDKVMDVFISRTPTLLGSVRNGDKASQYQRASMTITAPDPIWSDEGYQSNVLASQIDAFEFPLEITDTFIFAEVTEEGVEINNLGDLSTPIVITFEGLSTNPVIENATYGESLKLLTTISAGDIAIIDTDYNNPSVTITSGGVTTNAFQYIDPDNNALNTLLRRGINNIKYSSSDATQTTATLKYKNKWLTPFSGVIS